MPFKDKEKNKQWKTEYYQRNKLAKLMYYQLETIAFPEEVRERKKKYRVKNRDKLNEIKREHYKKNSEDLNARSKQWRKDNPEKTRAFKAEHVKRNRERYSNYERIRKHKQYYGEFYEAAEAAYQIKKELGNDKKETRREGNNENFNCE